MVRYGAAIGGTFGIVFVIAICLGTNIWIRRRRARRRVLSGPLGDDENRTEGRFQPAEMVHHHPDADNSPNMRDAGFNRPTLEPRMIPDTSGLGTTSERQNGVYEAAGDEGFRVQWSSSRDTINGLSAPLAQTQTEAEVSHGWRVVVVELAQDHPSDRTNEETQPGLDENNTGQSEARTRGIEREEIVSPPGLDAEPAIRDQPGSGG
jgi:hypothetical protein